MQLRPTICHYCMNGLCAFCETQDCKWIYTHPCAVGVAYKKRNKTQSSKTTSARWEKSEIKSCPVLASVNDKTYKTCVCVCLWLCVWSFLSKCFMSLVLNHQKNVLLMWLFLHDSRGTQPRAATHWFYKIKFGCNDYMYIWRLFQMKNICPPPPKKKKKKKIVIYQWLFFTTVCVCWCASTGGDLRASVKLNLAAKCHCRMQWEVSVTDAPMSRRPLCLWLNYSPDCVRLMAYKSPPAGNG